jgi:hypothetical protein
LKNELSNKLELVLRQLQINSDEGQQATKTLNKSSWTSRRSSAGYSSKCYFIKNQFPHVVGFLLSVLPIRHTILTRMQGGRRQIFHPLAVKTRRQNDDGAIETQQPHATPASTKTLPSVPGVFIHENHFLPHVFLINC